MNGKDGHGLKLEKLKPTFYWKNSDLFKCTCDLWNLTLNIPGYKCYFLLISASFALLKKEEMLIAYLFSWQGQFGVCENVVPKDEVSKLQKIIIILSNLIHDIFFC